MHIFKRMLPREGTLTGRRVLSLLPNATTSRATHVSEALAPTTLLNPMTQSWPNRQHPCSYKRRLFHGALFGPFKSPIQQLLEVRRVAKGNAAYCAFRRFN